MTTSELYKQIKTMKLSRESSQNSTIPVAHYPLAGAFIMPFVLSIFAATLRQQHTQTSGARYNFAFKNEAFFANCESANSWRSDRSSKVASNSARLWLIKRMEALQKRPLPTLQTVREQWADSMAFSGNLNDRDVTSLNGPEKEESS